MSLASIARVLTAVQMKPSSIHKDDIDEYGRDVLQTCQQLQWGFFVAFVLKYQNNSLIIWVSDSGLVCCPSSSACRMEQPVIKVQFSSLWPKNFTLVIKRKQAFDSFQYCTIYFTGFLLQCNVVSCCVLSTSAGLKPAVWYHHVETDSSVFWKKQTW